MAFEPPPLVAWAVNIRLAMVDDPGRKQLFNDIALHGYQWLEEYWENIVAGQNEWVGFRFDSIRLNLSELMGLFRTLVELVKTPARKKKKRAKGDKVARMKMIPDEVCLSIISYLIW
jgi:hypothetical protein